MARQQRESRGNAAGLGILGQEDQFHPRFEVFAAIVQRPSADEPAGACDPRAIAGPGLGITPYHRPIICHDGCQRDQGHHQQLEPQRATRRRAARVPKPGGRV